MRFWKRCLGIFLAAMLMAAPGMAEDQTAVSDQALEAETVGADENAEAVEAVGLTLNETKVSLDYSQMVTLTATGVSSDAKISWTTSDANVAELSDDRGEAVSVRAGDPGVATITCTSGEEEVTCTVTVWEPSTLQITGVDYPATFFINNGRGWSLRKGTLASNADLKTLTSVILDSSGAAVVEPYTREFKEGVRRYELKKIDNAVPFSSIKSEGAYTWRLSATDAAGATVQLDMPIQVQGSGSPQVECASGAYASLYVAHILVTPEAATVFPGDHTTLTAEVRPYNALNREVSWSSSDSSIATVDANGEVTGVALGKATITCTAVDGSQAVTSCDVSVVMKEGWQSEDGYWHFMYPDGSEAVNRIVEISGVYYGLDESGRMQNNAKFTVGSETYVAQEGGALLVNQWYQEGEIWYYCGATGALQTGWLELGDKKYYLDATGAMQTGWVQDNGIWYYFGGDGVLQTGGWLNLGDTYYYLDGEGAMQTGWLKDGEKWYYLDSSGIMVTGQQEIDGTVYNFEGSGALIQ